MTQLWYTSDLHLGHARVAELRGFPSIEAHDAHIMAGLRDNVRVGDTLIVVGDIAVGQWKRALAELGGIGMNLRLMDLVLGNHDVAHPMHRTGPKYQAAYFQAGFRSVQTFMRRRINGEEVLISHFPYTADHTADVRYTQYRLRDEGRWLLHGHIHSPQKWTGPREIHIGLDAWDLRPVPEHVIAKMMRDGYPGPAEQAG